MAEPTQETTPNPADPKRERDTTEEQSEGQVSEAASGFGDSEAATGGADAVPDTPDVNPGTSEPMRDSRA